MNIENLTISQAREIAALFNATTNQSAGDPDRSAFQIGQPYPIRTVTMTTTGRVVSVSRHEVVVEDAAWIADTGRFSDALKTGKYSEVEPFHDGQVIIGRASIIDAVRVTETPRSQK
jgi:hypothetical protein